MERWRSACPLSRRRFVGTAAVVAAAAMVGGCQQQPAPVDDAELDILLADWANSVRDRDRSAHHRVWAAAAPEVADRLTSSLLGLDLIEFSAASRPVAVAATLGGPRSVEVRWQLPGDTTQSHLLAVTAQRVGGAAALAPATDPDPEAPGEPRPLWWLQSTIAITSVRSGLLVGGVTGADQTWAGAPLADWQECAERAATAVSERTHRQTGDRSRVWFELASSSELARQVLGDGDLSAVAALAAAVGESSADAPAPIHVVLDPPDLGALSPLGATTLLTHEAVHVVTRAPYTDLPLWVEEGWAELVGWADDDDAGWRQTSTLLERIRAGDDVIALPDDETFTTASGDELTIAYALAWSLCRWMLAEAQRLGADNDGWELLRQWYDQQAPPDGSRGVSEADACAAVFQLSPEDREERWRDWLTARAGRQ